MSGWVDTRRNITSPFNESNVGFSRFIFSTSSLLQQFRPDHPHGDDCQGLVLAAPRRQRLEDLPRQADAVLKVTWIKPPSHPCPRPRVRSGLGRTVSLFHACRYQDLAAKYGHEIRSVKEPGHGAPKTGLSQFQLLVSDVGASARWYCAALGLDPFGEDPDIG
jgi:hypothetical protein